MASHHAHLSCVLKLEPRCDACKRHAMEVLGSIDGVYDVSINAETKTARIMGEVDPNYCLKALARCGIHAELVRANLTHPRLSAAGAYDPYGSYNHNYPRLGRSYHDHDHYAPHSLGYYGEPYRRSLPEGMWHDYPVRSALPDYSNNTMPYYGGSTYNTMPYYGGSTSYDRSYRRDMEYNPYAHEGMNMCSIM